MPKKIKKYTIIKSPMAHKTFSQEQLKWQEFQIKTGYKVTSLGKIKGLKNSLGFSVKQKKSLRGLNIGTNFFFCRKVTMLYRFYEKDFFIK